MKRVMNQEDIVDALSVKTGFYKKYLKIVMAALEEVVLENMNEATFEEPSEIMIVTGMRFGARRTPEREVRDPRTQEKVMTYEKIIPYCKYSQYFREKINGIYRKRNMGD